MDLTRKVEVYDTVAPRATKLTKEEALELRKRIETATPLEQETLLLLIAEHARREGLLNDEGLPYLGVEEDGRTAFAVKDLPADLLTRLWKFMHRGDRTPS